MIKKILTAVLFTLLPLSAFAYTGSWGFNSTSNPIYYPLSVNGNNPSVYATYFTATSTTGTSTFANSATFNGFVGIGTSTVSNLLSVAGNGFFNGNLTVTNITATGTLSVSGGTILANATTSVLAITGLTNTFLTVNASGQVVSTTTPILVNFWNQSDATTTNNVAKVASTLGVFGSVQATSSAVNTFVGNVGITYSNPGNALDIGTRANDTNMINFDGSDLAHTGRIQFNDGGWQIQGRSHCSGMFTKSAMLPALAFCFGQGGTLTEGLAFGRIGGYTSFEVANVGTALFKSQTAINLPSNLGVLNVVNSTTTLTTTVPSFAVWDNSATNKMLFGVLPSGNVGIGTTSPSNKLEVNGNLFTSGDATHANIIATGTLAVTSTSTLNGDVVLGTNVKSVAGIPSIGVPIVVKTGKVIASTSPGVVFTYTTPANDGMYHIAMHNSLTASVSDTIQGGITYTDPNNNTVTFGTQVIGPSISSTATALDLAVKGGTTITETIFFIVSSGSATYSSWGNIMRTSDI